jgi:hypothetical protein
VPVQVCLSDALSNPLQGAPISFTFQNLNGTGSVNGIANGGTLNELTGPNGCVTANVTTAGVVSGNPTLTFSSFGATAVVTIVPPTVTILQANPTFHRGDSPVVITLTLLDGTGQPINGTFITGSCTATGGATLQIIDPPGITGETGPGQTTATVDPDGFVVTNMTPPTGTCTFSAAGGTPSVTVNFGGFDQCDLGVSPPPPGCP